MFYIKVHDAGYRKIIAVCDKNIIGKSFRKDNLVLNISEDFYKGEIKSIEETKTALTSGENLNIAGNEAINLCLDLGLINKENIKEIEGTQYAMILEL